MLEDKAALHYMGDAGRRYHEGKRAISAKAFPWVAKLRAEKIAPYVALTDAVFEFGVGFGWNLAQLRCAKRLGCDVSTFLAPALQPHGIDFISEMAAVATDSIDVAISHHSLEHVLHPARSLQDLRRVIRPGGKLLLFVPYEKEKRYHSYHRDEPNHHLYSWNVQTLGNLVEENGFDVQEAHLGRFGYDRFAANWATRFNVGEAGFRLIRGAVHLMKPAYEVRVVAIKNEPRSGLQNEPGAT